MLDKIKTEFSISDLENLSGISAHTIRIWERRFHLLNPNRTNTNIRLYDTENLKKLLNISFLYHNGFKISKLATFTDLEIINCIQELSSKAEKTQHSINSLKLAMLGYDRFLFEKTYNNLFASLSFTDIFLKVFIPFLDTVGKLWMTGSITPLHEHFISNLIRQKLFLHVERLSYKKVNNRQAFILFLPSNELHEIGLLFIHYYLMLHEKDSVYLGQSVEINDLLSYQKPVDKSIVYITCFSVEPQSKNLISYIDELKKSVIAKNDQLWITGSKAKVINYSKSPKNVTVFHDAHQLLKMIDQLSAT